MTVKELLKPSKLSDYKTSKKLRVKYYLHSCKNGGDHIWELTVPQGKEKIEPREYYQTDIIGKFPATERGERVQLVWACASCKKTVITNPKICKKCGRAKKPLSKKMEKNTILYVRMKCHCYETETK